MEGFLIREWDLNLPVRGATSTLAQGATRAARWLHEPKPISNQPVRWGVHTLWGGIDAGDLPLSLGCWSCRGMEGFLTRGWEFILSGCGGTAALARGATLAARWLHEPQSISNHPVGLGFPHPAGRYRPGGSAFTSPASWICRDIDGFLTRGWELILPGVRWLSTIPSQSASGTGVSTPCGAVSTWAISVFVPGSLES